MSANQSDVENDFYVVAREPGAEHPALPTWANHSENPAGLSEDYPHGKIRRIDLPQVPGAYQLLSVLDDQECRALIDLSEALGYLPDAAVSLPRDVRHNDNVVWVTDEKTDTLIWQRVAALAAENLEAFGGHEPVGLNARFRFYRYGLQDYFKSHTDGAWPGSRVINDELIANAYPDRYSQMTFLLFLNEDYEGGATRFLVPALADGEAGEACYRHVDVRTPAGGVLCFPHGYHAQHCVHSSEPITQGTKYIIRTDMLFTL